MKYVNVNTEKNVIIPPTGVRRRTVPGHVYRFSLKKRKKVKGGEW